MRIAEDARKRFLTWLSWTFGVVGLFVTVLGLKGYSDWHTMLEDHRKELDDKVNKQVDENLTANFQDRTKQVIESVIDARTEFNRTAEVVAGVQDKAKTLDADLIRFREQLTKLENQTREKATEASAKIDQMLADYASSGGKRNQQLRQQQFINKGRDYAKKLGLTMPEPKLVFRDDRTEQALQAVYDMEANEYVINPSHLDDPGLAEYVALMGRFFEKNRTVLGNVGQPGFPESRLWQDFRYSVVDYLLATDMVRSRPDLPENLIPFYHTLKVMEKKADVAAVRKLALALLESFGAEWNAANFRQKVLAVNDKVKALPAEAVSEALAGWK